MGMATAIALFWSNKPNPAMMLSTAHHTYARAVQAVVYRSSGSGVECFSSSNFRAVAAANLCRWPAMVLAGI